MKVNTKKFIRTWIISLVIMGVLSSSVTALLLKPEPIETVEEVHHHHSYFFTPKVQEPKLAPVMIQEVEPLIQLLGEYTITAYCSCEICCGEWANNRPDGIVYGASMEELKADLSVAASSDFEFGSVILIDGQEYVVQDRPANWIVDKYEGKIIDVYFDDHQEALEFGKQFKEIYLKEGEDYDHVSIGYVQEQPSRSLHQD
jgi:3D (Asp-Asp-Asp) domain-containing protein